jgi:energy-converting hydrogenase B subunit J
MVVNLLNAIPPTVFGIWYVGPLLFSFLMGLIIGTLMHKTPVKDIKVTTTAWVAILIGGIIIAYWLGNFPYYGNFPFGPGFVMVIIGAMIGRKLFGTKAEA